MASSLENSEIPDASPPSALEILPLSPLESFDSPRPPAPLQLNNFLIDDQQEIQPPDDSNIESFPVDNSSEFSLSSPRGPPGVSLLMKSRAPRISTFAGPSKIHDFPHNFPSPPVQPPPRYFDSNLFVPRVFPLFSSSDIAALCPREFPSEVAELVGQYAANRLASLVLTRKGQVIDFLSGAEVCRLPALSSDDSLGLGMLGSSGPSFSGFCRVLFCPLNERPLIVAATQNSIFICALEFSSVSSGSARLRLVASWKFHSRPEEEKNCRNCAIVGMKILPGALLAAQAQCGHVRIISLTATFQAFFRLGKDFPIGPADLLISLEPQYFTGCGNCGLLHGLFVVHPGFLVSLNAADRIHNDMNVNIYSFTSKAPPALIFSFALEASRSGKIELRHRPEQTPIVPNQEDDISTRLHSWLADLFAAVTLSMKFHSQGKSPATKIRFHYLDERTLLSIDEKLRVFISRETGDEEWELFPTEPSIAGPSRSFAGSSLIGSQLVVAVSETTRRSSVVSPTNARSSLSKNIPSSPYKRRSFVNGSVSDEAFEKISTACLYCWEISTRKLVKKSVVPESIGSLKAWLAEAD